MSVWESAAPVSKWLSGGGRARNELRAARVGQPLVVPKGIEVWSMNPQHDGPRETKRQQTVRPQFVSRYDDGRMVITWAGSGGYWQRIYLEADVLPSPTPDRS